MSEYLPSDTLQWCRHKLEQFGFNPSDHVALTSDSYNASPHQSAYIWLCGQIFSHQSQELLPHLELCIWSTGAFDWCSEIVKQEIDAIQQENN